MKRHRPFATYQNCLVRDIAQGQCLWQGALAGKLGWQLTGWSVQCLGCFGGSCGMHCPPYAAWRRRPAVPACGTPSPGRTRLAGAEPSPHLLSDLHNTHVTVMMKPSCRQNITQVQSSIHVVHACLQQDALFAYVPACSTLNQGSLTTMHHMGCRKNCVLPVRATCMMTCLYSLFVTPPDALAGDLRRAVNHMCIWEGRRVRSATA